MAAYDDGEGRSVRGAATLTMLPADGSGGAAPPPVLEGSGPAALHGRPIAAVGRIDIVPPWPLSLGGGSATLWVQQWPEAGGGKTDVWVVEGDAFQRQVK